MYSHPVRLVHVDISNWKALAKIHVRYLSYRCFASMSPMRPNCSMIYFCFVIYRFINMQAIEVLHRRKLDVWSIESAASPGGRRRSLGPVCSGAYRVNINRRETSAYITLLVKALLQRTYHAVRV